jgi:hypothetical protein
VKKDWKGILLRHGLAAVGGVAVAAGWLTDDEATAIIGALGPLVAIGLSFIEGRKRENPAA